MTHQLTHDECEALIELIGLEQIYEIDDDVNENWNTIRRKLHYIRNGGVTCSIDNVEVDCETWT